MNSPKDQRRYELFLSDEASKILSKLESHEEQRIKSKIKEMAGNPERYGKKMVGSHLYSLRSGSYRVIYMIDHHAHTVFVVTIGHRSTIYDRTV